MEIHAGAGVWGGAMAAQRVEPWEGSANVKERLRGGGGRGEYGSE